MINYAFSCCHQGDLTNKSEELQKKVHTGNGHTVDTLKISARYCYGFHDVILSLARFHGALKHSLTVKTQIHSIDRKAK